MRARPDCARPNRIEGSMPHALANLKIGTKLGLGFAAVLALLVAVAAISLWGLESGRRDFEIYTGYAKRTVGLAVADRDLENLWRNAENYLQTGDATAAATVRARGAAVTTTLADIQ